jgi:hypothetical protein
MRNLARFAELLIVLGAAHSLASDVEYMKASLTDHKGNTVQVSRIRASTEVKGKYKGQDLGVPLKNLKRVENLGNGHLRVTNLSNEQFTLEDATIWNERGNYNYIRYWLYSDIDKQDKEKYVSSSEFVQGLHTLALSSDVGRLKYNPQTKKYFPPDYIYDPFTGEKLDWKTPEQ